jgi:hypothetical protein
MRGKTVAINCDELQKHYIKHAAESLQKARREMNDEQANRTLRPAVILWTFAGIVGIPLAVYFDFLGGWRWPPCVARAPPFLHRKNVTMSQVQCNLRSNDGERVFRGGHVFCTRH